MGNDALPAQGGHYSRSKVAAGLLFTAGLVPRDSERQLIGHTVEDQTRAVLAQLQTILTDAGCSLSDLVRVQVYLADLGDFARFNATYAAVMGDAKPVRTTTGCALNGVLVEIDAIADLSGVAA